MTPSLLVGAVGGLRYHLPTQGMCLEERIVDHGLKLEFMKFKFPVVYLLCYRKLDMWVNSEINPYVSLYFILPQLFQGYV